ncbi:hypothetical protein FHU28_001656 [Micromonospora echinospora]|uniref:Uncharacterized protein n=1 Tax=Micromonospora echinospora TaxID=1877 RepID=A0ABR6MBR1_MICEC|nr:hypothetical protein [Micromonospora echinospora]
MSVLYPRLLPNEAERLFSSLHGRNPEDIAASASVISRRAVYAATGGTRVSPDELRALGNELERLAEAGGFPNPPTTAARNEFDRATARYLHQRSGMVPGEASQRQVWAFLSLVLVPHICAWRFPMRNGLYLPDRFKGTDLTRHSLARLWTRAHVLFDPSLADPYELLPWLGEADLDHVMARRRSISTTPGLVRAIVRCHAEDADIDEGVPARAIHRDSLRRLLRLTAFLNLDWMTQQELLELVREQRNESRRLIAKTNLGMGNSKGPRT